MGLSVGTHVGPYQIVSTLGAGGMGDVYRARDPRLGRDVAIKALPDSVAADPDRIARFQREAQILASLNHPHIAALYGLEEIDGSRYLILELVEGATLADRLRTGPLPLHEALTIARQVADGLQAAHEKGIVHRDLKPANIGLTPEGQVKVLDFGLAKALEPPLPGNVADSPTVTTAGTRFGVVLGTAAYMSPDQARGLPIDKRTDIWAFGCVLYEMLTGRRAFSGKTTSDVIAAVLEREPDWSSTPHATPTRIDWLLRRCLEKDPKRRLHDIADAGIEIDEALSRPSGSAEPAGRSLAAAKTRERLAWGVAAAVVIALAVILSINRNAARDRTAPESARYSTSIVLPDDVHLAGGSPPGRFALSPNGRHLALIASDSTGRSMLYVRPLNSRVAHPLEGTAGAAFPFWSQDSRFIAFLAENKLKKVEATGGEVVTLADATFGATGAWNRDDVILFTPKGNSPLFRLSASSGSPIEATSLDPASGDVQHSFPFFLPDGRHFLFFVVGTKAGQTVPRGVYAGSLDEKGPGKLIVEGASNAKYANGHLVYLHAGALLAQPFDVDRLELQGQPVPVVEGVQTSSQVVSEVTGAFTLSETGILAYQTGSLVRSQLTWFDRRGTRLGTLGDPDDYIDVALSPDDSRVATSVLDVQRGTRDIWTFQVKRGLGERFTFEAGDDFAPNWSQPGGDRIFFSSLRQGSIHLYEKAASGSAPESLLLQDDLGKFNPRPSRDGRFLIYVAGGGIIGRSDIWVLPMSGERKAFPFIETRFPESQPQFSPDGRWVAFMSAKSDRREVYVTSFPDRTSEVRVSTAGGSLPRWSRDGKEIFYVAQDGTLTVTMVDGHTLPFEVGPARQLFTIHPRPARLDAYPYDVTADGQRILVNTFIEEVAPPIALIVNWMPTR
jgi:serine/threonine protein kinase/Tol biopolymer transport system component